MKFRESQPIYMQIADFFCEKILKEEWEAGTKIPSVREIAAQMEVNPNTAMRAFSFVQDHDIIFNKRGIGYFVAENAKNKALELQKQNFIENELPYLFGQMKLLDLDCRQMEELYNKVK